MKTSLALAFAAAITFAPVAFAETTHEDIAADKGAIKKDDAAIAKQHGNVAVNRDEKAAAKESGNVADQASQSLQIGANKTVIEGKKLEKKVDQKILEHDKKNAQ